MKIVEEFSEFLKKYQVLGLAVAFIIGAASTKLVTALVNDIIMPLVGIAIPNGDWRSLTLPVGNAQLLVGDFLGALVDFVIIAIVVFGVVKFIMKEHSAEKRRDTKYSRKPKGQIALQ
ncbi:MAG TPA: large conductance mechanosensitive channel protein MscL [archaeon]|nr:large conductance mechanosensitive channel protein MscL [archaeon]